MVNITTSLNHAVLDADVPLGAWAAAAEATNNAQMPEDVERDAYAEHISRSDGLESTDPSLLPTETATTQHTSQPDLEEERLLDNRPNDTGNMAHIHAASSPSPSPKLPWTTMTRIGLAAFWKWFRTPFGFLLTLYALNVVAWGGMLFLLLCNASPAMCWVPDGHGGRYHNCNDLNSPRRKWLEIDSQILNAFFCVTGFGLIPWRFRDLYYLLRWRLCSEKRHGLDQKIFGLRKLAGIHRSWFRLPGSETVDQLSASQYRSEQASSHTIASTKPENVEAGPDDLRLPVPSSKIPEPPLTGVRAPPTAAWKLDFFIWCQVCNTFLQACLCYFMWGMNRFNRPSWATGLFIALACIVAGAGGIVSYLEGKSIKKIEGVRPNAAVEKAIMKAKMRNDLKLTNTTTTLDGREEVHVVGKEKTGAGDRR